MKRQNAWNLVGCAGLVLVAFGLRTWRLDAQPLHGDEAFSVLFSSMNLSKMLNSMLTTEPNPPLYWLALRAWMALAGQSEFSVRFLSVLFSTATIPLLVQFGRRLFGRRAGWLAALLGVVNPFYLWYAQETRMYAMVAALALASLVLFLAFIAPSHAACKHVVGLVVATTLALYTHYFTALIWLVENILFFLTPRRRKDLKTWLQAQGAIALLFAPWLAFVAPSLLQHEKAWLFSLNLGEMIERAIAAYSLGTAIPAAMLRPLAAGFLLIAILGLAAALGRERRSGIIAGLILFVPVLIVYLISLRRPVFHERYLIVIVPAYLTLLGRGVTALLPGPPGRSRQAAIGGRWVAGGLMLAFIAFGSAQGIYHYQFDPAFAKAPDWRGLVRTLRDRVGPSDIVVQNYPDPALPYYMGQDRLITLPVRNPVDRLAESGNLRAVLAAHDRLWLLLSPDPSWDPEGFVKAWLDRRAERVWAGQVAGFDLVVYRRVEPPVPSHQVDWRLGDNIRLIGYDFEAIDAPGQYLLTLYWQCTAPMDISYSVFTHLLDKSGHIVTQHDSWPQQNAFPTSDWLPGDIVRDQHPLALPPSVARSDLTLEVGLYQLENGQRVPVFMSNGQHIEGDQVFLPVIDPRHP